MIRKLADFGRAFRQEFTLSGERLFQDLIWPAAAGNVVWSLAQLIVNPPAKDRYPSGVLLLLTGAYLVIDWLRSDSATEKTWKYRLGDAILVTGVVVLALAVQYKNQLVLHLILSAVFAAAVILHLLGAWERPRRRRWLRRWCMAGCGLLGLLIIGVSYVLFGRPIPWTLPVSFLTVLLAWVAVRTIMNERNDELQSAAAAS